LLLKSVKQQDRETTFGYNSTLKIVNSIETPFDTVMLPRNSAGHITSMTSGQVKREVKTSPMGEVQSIGSTYEMTFTESNDILNYTPMGSDPIIYGYNKDLQPTILKHGSAELAMSYNQKGRLTSIGTGDGFRILYGYDGTRNENQEDGGNNSIEFIDDTEIWKGDINATIERIYENDRLASLNIIHEDRDGGNRQTNYTYNDKGFLIVSGEVKYTPSLGRFNGTKAHIQREFICPKEGLPGTTCQDELILRELDMEMSINGYGELNELSYKGNSSYLDKGKEEEEDNDVVVRDPREYFKGDYSSRDEIGRLKKKTETMFDRTYNSETNKYEYTPATVITDYTYDKKGRVSSIKSNETEIIYGHNSRGNITHINGEEFAIYEGDQIKTLQIKEVIGSGETPETINNDINYAYSSRGSIKTKTETNGRKTTYSYNAFGNLEEVSIVKGDLTTTIIYNYDSFQRRVFRRVSGKIGDEGVPEYEEKFLYGDMQNPIAKFGTSGKVIEFYVYGEQNNVPLYMQKDENTYLFISDNLGTVRAVIDVKTHEIVQKLEYDHLGKVIVDTNPGFQPFGYAGGMYDPETGLTNFGDSDYYAEAGIRLQSNLRKGSDVGSLSLSAYAGGDHVNRLTNGTRSFNINEVWDGVLIGAGITGGALLSIKAADASYRLQRGKMALKGAMKGTGRVLGVAGLALTAYEGSQLWDGYVNGEITEISDQPGNWTRTTRLISSEDMNRRTGVMIGSAVGLVVAAGRGIYDTAASKFSSAKTFISSTGKAAILAPTPKIKPMVSRKKIYSPRREKKGASHVAVTQTRRAAETTARIELRKLLNVTDFGLDRVIKAARKVGVYKVDDVVIAARKIGLSKVSDIKQLLKGWNSITTKMEKKILYGIPRPNKPRDVIGAHSPNVFNDPRFDVFEIIKVNADGTKMVRFKKDLGNGVVSKPKKNTQFPESWTDEEVIYASKHATESPVIGRRFHDGATLHRSKINGVNVDVIKEGNIVTSAFPPGNDNILAGFDPI